MRFAYWITKATDTHSEYIIPIAFPHNNDCMNAPHCYVSKYIGALLKPTVVTPVFTAAQLKTLQIAHRDLP